MKRTILMIAFLVLAIVLLAQENKSRKEIRAEKNAKIEACVDSIVASQNFTIIAQIAQPMSWQQIPLSSSYFLTLKGDSVEVILPYFGRAYMVSYASMDGGIKLNSPIENYLKKQKRKNIEISFETRTETDSYQFQITVTSSGYASIFVSSDNRQSINFNGILDQVGL